MLQTTAAVRLLLQCKSCNSLLEKDDAGCVNCGTPKEAQAEAKTGSNQNINTFRLHETATDRTIEATFSDHVAKVAGTSRNFAAGRMKALLFANLKKAHFF